ncbi:MAG: hypothetical protein HYV16_16790 [Gammaproteobacteria bacterium]|nr:hypothetical protein [Gammaproteobacteria bacterium]
MAVVASGGGGGGGGGCIPSGDGGCTYPFLMGLVPEMQQNLESAIRVAKVLGTEQMQVIALKEAIALEIRSCLEAAEELGLIKIPHGVRAQVLDATTKLTNRTYGLV